MSDMPERIWVQVEDGEEYGADTTWCEDKINDGDVGFVRADLAVPPKREQSDTSGDDYETADLLTVSQARVDKLADALRVVKDNFDKCRLIDRAEAEIHLDKGKGYMSVPHEQCISAIRAALEDERE